MYQKRWLKHCITWISDWRANARYPGEGTMLLSWSEGFVVYVMQGECVNRSQGGFAIRSCREFHPKTLVYARAEQQDGVGFATVRYCREQDTGYIIGFEYRKLRAPQDLGELNIALQGRAGDLSGYPDSFMFNRLDLEMPKRYAAARSASRVVR